MGAAADRPALRGEGAGRDGPGRGRRLRHAGCPLRGRRGSGTPVRTAALPRGDRRARPTAPRHRPVRGLSAGADGHRPRTGGDTCRGPGRGRRLREGTDRRRCQSRRRGGAGSGRSRRRLHRRRARPAGGSAHGAPGRRRPRRRRPRGGRSRQSRPAHDDPARPQPVARTSHHQVHAVPRRHPPLPGQGRGAAGSPPRADHGGARTHGADRPQPRWYRARGPARPRRGPGRAGPRRRTGRDRRLAGAVPLRTRRPDRAGTRRTAAGRLPRWLNIYDRQDLLAFMAEPVFPADPRVTDHEVSSRQPFLPCHSAYWKLGAVYDRIAHAVAEIA